jgi:hypothetical protein
VNLLYADLTGLPPIDIYYGEYEILAGSVIEFAGRATGCDERRVAIDVSKVDKRFNDRSWHGRRRTIPHCAEGQPSPPIGRAGWRPI